MNKSLAEKFGRIFSSVIAAVFVLNLFPVTEAQAATPADKFVRTAAPFMKIVAQSDYDDLAKFDLVILPAELQEEEPSVFQELRSRNPNIIILAYVPTKSYIVGWGDTLHTNLKAGITDNMWLRDSYGAAISVWPGTQALSATSSWNTYLPQYVHDHILNNNNWDGIFYDEVSDTISWVNNGNVDLNRDGIADGAATADAAWKNGMITMLKTARNLDQQKIFVINGTSTPEFQPLINGRMFESFPAAWEAGGDWYELMRRYVDNLPIVVAPEAFIINSNTGNTGAKDDYQKMRFGLASALMGDGYFSFDFGDQDHGQTWRYDEYGVYLGKPTGPPKNATTGASVPADAAAKFSSGVWERNFEKGIALVNPTSQPQTIVFDSEFEKIRGTQDSATNDGSIVSSVTIPAHDGLIMLRPLDKISNAPYFNGSFVRVWNASGSQTRDGFFAYDDRFKGSSQVLEEDINGDGGTETVAADKTNITVYNSGGTVIASWQPWGAKWKNGMEFGVGDVLNNGKNEIVVGAGAGGAPEVKIYDLSGRQLGSFMAYAKNFKGGVHLAVGNTDADPAAEIITGAGPGGGPHVRVWSASGIIKDQFFAFAQTFRGGVYVAVGDIAGLKHGQIIAGAGAGGSPQVRVFDPGNKNAVLAQFYAFAQSSKNGVKVSAGDIQGNGKTEIITQSNDVFAAASLDAPPAEVEPRLEEVQPQIPTEVSPESPQIPEHPLFLGMPY
jgi:Hypothetical glycosyl hydrolase family 15